MLLPPGMWNFLRGREPLPEVHALSPRIENDESRHCNDILTSWGYSFVRRRVFHTGISGATVMGLAWGQSKTWSSRHSRDSGFRAAEARETVESLTVYLVLSLCVEVPSSWE